MLSTSLELQLGFDSMHFARIDYQDRATRKADNGLEVIWRGSRTFRSSSQVLIVIFMQIVLYTFYSLH
jgi:alpha-mannosidase